MPTQGTWDNLSSGRCYKHISSELMVLSNCGVRLFVCSIYTLLRRRKLEFVDEEIATASHTK